MFTGMGVLLSVSISIDRFSWAIVTSWTVGLLRVLAPGEMNSLISSSALKASSNDLKTYLEVPPTAGMTNAIVKVMAEVLYILAVATKEIKQNSASKSVPGSSSLLSAYLFPEKFMKKLAGRTDLEDALHKLETVTLEEARMAAAESLKAICSVGDKVMGVDGKMDGVQDTLKVVEDRVRGVEGMLQGVDVRAKGIGDKVINGVQAMFNLTSLHHFS